MDLLKIRNNDQLPVTNLKKTPRIFYPFIRE